MAFVYGAAISRLREETMKLKASREALLKGAGQIYLEGNRFLNALATVVSHGGQEVSFSWGTMAFTVALGDKGKYVCKYDPTTGDGELRRYVDDMGLDLRLACLLYILNHSDDVAAACAEAVRARREVVDEGTALMERLTT
ncbi:hypothetical protein KAR29_13530 [Aminithiophilus ramosus]|uniref:Uncharacterized protein n=2 Tax=Synergistales TaxID=649776 RepID=A0A9Q7EV92_9BACT|nr:hypothetical protein [Aminithiophilus ramosus]QTX32303.1 hypothetical protein KAR29_13530 [Aminithiophilus ramosus]QVL36169.1 hypothetical protein KIH16_13725 [Synergistota bacterium]